MGLSIVQVGLTWSAGNPLMKGLHSLKKLLSVVTIAITFDLEKSLIPSENSCTILKVWERDHFETNKQYTE